MTEIIEISLDDLKRIIRFEHIDDLLPFIKDCKESLKLGGRGKDE